MLGSSRRRTAETRFARKTRSACRFANGFLVWRSVVIGREQARKYARRSKHGHSPLHQQKVESHKNQ
jgi:hypothetical protein